MPEPRCPGQDWRYWKPEDIFTAACPHCGGEIEFWKDEPFRICPACRQQAPNPKQDFGCAAWCKHGPACLNPKSSTDGPAGAKTG